MDDGTIFSDESHAQSASISTEETHHELHSGLVDIGVNLTHDALKKNWRNTVERAVDEGVDTIIVTGTSLKSSRESLAIARSWYKQQKQKNLFATVGVHPHDAKKFISTTTGRFFKAKDCRSTIEQMREMLLRDPFAVAVGECGLDFNRIFSTREDQVHAFREQVHLACELQVPLYVRERGAHHDLLEILDEARHDESIPPLPPVVVRCFTGTQDEAMDYIERGFYIGFAGMICIDEQGQELRQLLPNIPLDRVLIETDAPYMAFKKVRRGNSEPAHVVDIAETISNTLFMQYEEVCSITTRNARTFFRLDQPISLMHASTSPFCRVKTYVGNEQTPTREQTV